jgi:GTP cyclohydrolase II
VAAWRDMSALSIAARAHLPTAACEDAEIVAFRSADDMREHVALVIGTALGRAGAAGAAPFRMPDRRRLRQPQVRLRPQLDGALQEMAKEAANGGWGVLLYLRQEGRGIGLVNKLRAYRLQDQGFDTLEANRRLGLPDEARDFPIAARMLDLLGINAVRLLTNNPAKVAALEASGLEVAERVPHSLPPNPHNERYLATKRDGAGHLL